MGRHKRIGLEYFPLECGYHRDPKVELMTDEFGMKGEIIYLRLLAMIYEDKGYYMQWGEDEARLFAKRVGYGVTGALVDEVVRGCIRRSLFSERVFNTFKILTSHGIQKRYLNICKQLSRSVEIEAKLRVRESVFEEKGFSPEDIPKTTEEKAITTEESAQRKGKENKGKEMEGALRKITVEDEIWLDEMQVPSGKSANEIRDFCEKWIYRAALDGRIEKYGDTCKRFIVQDLLTKKTVAAGNDSVVDWILKGK